MTWLWINIPFMLLTLVLALGPLVYAIVTDTGTHAAAPGADQPGRAQPATASPPTGPDTTAELVGAGAGRGGGWH